MARASPPKEHIVWTKDHALKQRFEHDATITFNSESASPSSNTGSDFSSSSAHQGASEEHGTGAGSSSLKQQKKTGSELHAFGRCTPCVFIDKGVTCPKGAKCPYCHEFDDGMHAKRRRPGKQQRTRLR